MNFLSTSFFSAIATIVKLTSNLLINKIIAIYIGPTGIALIGQFANIFGTITAFGNGAINSGVTKYVAEYNTDVQRRNDFVTISLFISVLFSIVTGCVIYYNSIFLSEWIMKTDVYSEIFKLLSIVLIFISLNSVLLSVINGLKLIKLFIIVNITGSVFSLIVTTILTIKYSLYGALLSMIIVQSLIFFISFIVVFLKTDIKLEFRNILNIQIYRKLLAYSIMSIISILSVALSQLAIREHLIINFSIAEAGYWQGIWMISSMYLLVLTTALSTYYLPRISEVKDKLELRREIIAGYKIIIPFVIVTALGIFFLKDWIIHFLFTPDFMHMRSLFLFQLIGDFFKMSSWILAYLMIAKAMTKLFIITEIIFAISFYILTLLLTSYNGLIGVTQAYALNYSIYLIVMFVFFGNVFSEKKILFTKNIL